MTKRAQLVTDSCAFLPCDQVAECAFGPGQCVQKRFPQQQGANSASSKDTLRKGAPAHVGTRPGRGTTKR